MGFFANYGGSAVLEKLRGGAASGKQQSSVVTSQESSGADDKGRVAQKSTCGSCVVHSAEDAERIPLLEFTAEEWNEGAPRVGLTRGGLSYAERIEALLRTRRSALSHIQLLSAAAAAEHDRGAKPLRTRAGRDSRALQILAGRIRGHARSRASAHQ